MTKHEKQILKEFKESPKFKSRTAKALAEALEAGAKISEIGLLWNYIQEKYKQVPISENKLRNKFRFYWCLLNDKFNEK